MGDMDTALGERAVRIPASGGAKLAADLALPQPAAGLVMVASCWRSPRVRRRTQPVVAALAECDFATLRLDLLTVEESARDELALVPRRTPRTAAPLTKWRGLPPPGASAFSGAWPE